MKYVFVYNGHRKGDTRGEICFTLETSDNKLVDQISRSLDFCAMYKDKEVNNGD